MVAEARAARLDLAARVDFTKAGRPITETRSEIEELLGEPAQVNTLRTAQAIEHLTAGGG